MRGKEILLRSDSGWLSLSIADCEGSGAGISVEEDMADAIFHGFMMRMRKTEQEREGGAEGVMRRRE